jgi:hypothetical protein
MQVVPSLIPVVMASILGVTSSHDQVAAFVMGIVSGGPLLLLLVASFLLWKKAEVIASRMLPQSDDPIVISGFSSQELLSIAFAAIGMYVLVNALPQFGRHLAVTFWQNSRFVDSWNNPNWQIGFWINLFQIGIGVWLMVGMHGIARVVRSLQHSNVPEGHEG